MYAMKTATTVNIGLTNSTRMMADGGHWEFLRIRPYPTDGIDGARGFRMAIVVYNTILLLASAHCFFPVWTNTTGGGTPITYYRHAPRSSFRYVVHIFIIFNFCLHIYFVMTLTYLINLMTFEYETCCFLKLMIETDPKFLEFRPCVLAETALKCSLEEFLPVEMNNSCFNHFTALIPQDQEVNEQ